MIIQVTGQVEAKSDNFVIVTNQGLGYKITLPEEIVSQVSGDVLFYTHEVIRDDIRELFGFFSLEALKLFWKLISVSGVGPRGQYKYFFPIGIFLSSTKAIISHESLMSQPIRFT
ncbi:OB-fold domain-containing protein [Patescibacteria group bacterium]